MLVSNDLIKQIRRIEIRTRHKVEDLFAGSHLSAFKGRGIEFDGSATYQSGDAGDRLTGTNCPHGRAGCQAFNRGRELTVP